MAPTVPRNVRARAPLRADLAGGTLDLWPLGLLHPGAATVAVAVSLNVEAWAGAPATGGVYDLSAADRAATRRVRVGTPEPPLRDDLELLERVARAIGPEQGASLTTRAPVRAGSGLGTSSALGVAAAAALHLAFSTRSRLTGRERENLIPLIQDVEAQILGIPTGTQDHRAALNGGIVVIDHDPGGARVYRAAGRLLSALAARMILVDTGEARSSAPSNWDMYRRRIDGDPDATRALERVAHAGRAAADAIAAEDWTALGRAMSEDLEARAAWSPLVVTEPLAQLFAAARAAGALGARVCGAGGGGFAVILCDPEERARIAAAAAAAVAPVGGAVATRVRPVARGLQLKVEPGHAGSAAP